MEYSPLKLMVMRALWESNPARRSRSFDTSLVNTSCEMDMMDLMAASSQADAVLDAIEEPNEDMVKGGCLEADPVGALIGYDPERSSTQADVVVLYKAMIKEGRERNNKTRVLKSIHIAL